MKITVKPCCWVKRANGSVKRMEDSADEPSPEVRARVQRVLQDHINETWPSFWPDLFENIIWPSLFRAVQQQVEAQLQAEGIEVAFAIEEDA